MNPGSLSMNDWRSNASAFAELLAAAAASLASSPVRAHSCVRLPARGRLLITGDLHGNTIHFEAAITAARLGRSRDHHVVLQEVIHGDSRTDGLDMSHRLLARIAELVLAYPGQVHPILANHELAQCRGHPIVKSGVNCVEAFDEGIEHAFGDDAQIAADAVRRFITAMPLAVVCENGVAVTHSLPNASAMRRFDTRVLERALCDEDFDPPYGAAYLLTWGRSHDPVQLISLARDWGVSVFIVGHAPAPDGVGFRAPNMVVLNSGHAEGRVIDLDLAARTPSAAALAVGAVALAAFLRDDHASGQALA